MNSLVIDLKDLVNRTALDKGFEVIAVELHTHQNPMTIQVQIRPQGGGDVSLDDCALLNTPISDALDQSKLLQNPYILEISSPGLPDLLTTDRDFETFKGFPIEVSFIDDQESEVKKNGLLHEKSKDELKINSKGRVTIIPITSVIKVQLTTSKE
ncbi:ribosome assembly cofactor RimP [Prochlorococcus sp. MIT 1223]|uniref:ribosome assembly cofactor RimP n=1 Tax=Prochlorococcus sp. MIT 1223 TaxID=3096217 RepID=UPI002A74B65C|nr:ribosome assembly cofactor RimP [Prochlorococcus sp. MIT 1223]